MRNSETHKKQINIFGLGASYDLAPELSSMAKQGFYKDSQNMRLSNTNQLDFSLDRIKGEEVRYGNGTYSGAYTCIGVAEVNYHPVEVWCADDDSDVYFRIDGELMLCDIGNKMKLSTSHPLQVHKNDSCNGGEFYFTDNVNPPYIYSIQDIIDKHLAGSQLYKNDFNPLLYQTLLTQTLNAPVFVELEYSGVAGLPPGEYSYSFRYVDDSGNRTLFSPPTPLIPVIASREKGSDYYAYSKTYGADTALANTDFNPKIQFRVDNKLNYKYIEIGRIAWNENQAVGYVPIKQYYQVARELLDGEFGVWEWTDNPTNTWIDITDADSADQMGAIETAKAIRYFNGQLVLGNITYASRDLDGVVTFKKDDGELAHPFIDDIGVRAYSDPWNSTYKKQYMGGERYGFGVACYDSLGNISLVLPIDDGVIDLKNYPFPNRREQVSARTLDLSENNWKGVPRAADINNNPGVPVHERMQFKPPYNNKTGGDFKSISSAAPYSVLHPTKYNDTYADHNYQINTEVCSLYQMDGSPYMLSHEYEPYTFSPNIYAQALAIAGLDSYPDWVSAFSIVRTKPAGRVLAQGLSMYSLLDTYQDKGDVISDGYNLINKIKDKSWFFSDDVNNGYASISDSNSVQFVSPVGYFSEVYSNEYEKAITGHPYCKNCDMILYADQFYTDPSSKQSPELKHHTDSSAYWTKFGEWRYDHGASSPFAGSNGNKIFPLSGVYSDTFKGSSSARSLYNILTYDAGYEVYAQDTAQSFGLGDVLDVNDTNTQAWHEPFYIANIVNDGKNVPDNNINEYVLTGHFQKIVSKIGLGTGAAQIIKLIDERWQDCMVNYYSATAQDDNVFIKIRDSITGVERYWLDITYKSAIDTAAIISNLTNNGVHILNNVYAVGDSIRVTGVYTSTFDYNYDRDFYINFNVIPSLDNYYTIPDENSEILVRYDNRFPLIVYGGDTVIGRTVFAPVDGESDGGGNVVDQNQLFSWVGFPYPAYTFNPGYFIVADSGVGAPQTTFTIPINIIRQMVVMFYAESRSHLPFYHSELSTAVDNCDPSNYEGNNFFPQVHYVMRPIKWDTDCVDNFDDHGGHVSALYKNDYPGEFFYWGMGGFRINPSTATMNNRDYSQWNSFNTEFSKPQVGFTEKTKFCSRVIWSVKRNINEQNDPNLKTFLALNAYDINDANQEIKFLYDNDSDKGNNLLALTGTGVCLLLTEKKLISQATGNDLTYLDADKLVSGEYWLSKTIGCSNEMWRGCAEYDNQLFFPNSESVYRLSGLKIDDIGRNNNGSYFSKLNPALQSIDTGFIDSVCAVYDVKHSEYWLHLRKNYGVDLHVPRILNLAEPINNDGVYDYTASANENITVTSDFSLFDLIMPKTGFNEGDVFYITPIGSECHVHYVYGSPTVAVFQDGNTYMCEYLGGNVKPQWRFEQVDYIRNNGCTYVYNNDIQKQVWTGYTTYFADKMLNVYGNTQKDLGVLLMRDFNTYDTNVGDYINGDTVNGAVSFYIASDPYATKEFIDQTFNCNQAPTYCDYSNYNNAIPEATQVHFKNYTHGYYTQIPRKQDLDRYRFQGKYLWCNVGCDSIGDWSLSMVESGYKGIR